VPVTSPATSPAIDPGGVDGAAGALPRNAALLRAFMARHELCVADVLHAA
jgi:hypothetical protein